MRRIRTRQSGKDRQTLYKDLAKAILKKYDLHPVIIMDKDLDVKAKYIPEEDKVIFKTVNVDKDINKNDPKELMLTILHEAKHMLDARSLGISKFLKKYAQAGNIAVHCGRDYHDDNKWEIRAEKWAHKEYNDYWIGDREDN